MSMLVQNILKHIADHVTGELHANIVATNYSFSILVNVIATLSTKSALIVYILIQVKKLGLQYLSTISSTYLMDQQV